MITTIENLLKEYSCIEHLTPEYCRNVEGDIDIWLDIEFFWVHRGETKKRNGIFHVTGSTTTECIKKIVDYLESFSFHNL